MCGDGGSHFFCDSCPRITCRRCISVPAEDEDNLIKPDIKFRCVRCHWKGDDSGTPYMVRIPVLYLFIRVPIFIWYRDFTGMDSLSSLRSFVCLESSNS